MILYDTSMCIVYKFHAVWIKINWEIYGTLLSDVPSCVCVCECAPACVVVYACVCIARPHLEHELTPLSSHHTWASCYHQYDPKRTDHHCEYHIDIRAPALLGFQGLRLTVSKMKLSRLNWGNIPAPHLILTDTATDCFICDTNWSGHWL